jgi:hypothetical protein
MRPTNKEILEAVANMQQGVENTQHMILKLEEDVASMCKTLTKVPPLIERIVPIIEKQHEFLDLIIKFLRAKLYDDDNVTPLLPTFKN